MKAPLASVVALALFVGACGSSSPGDAPESATAEAKTPLEVAYAKCSTYEDTISGSGDGSSVTIDTGADGDTEGLLCVLDSLNVSESLTSRMENTNSLMGQVNMTEGGLEYSWSYHPDNGLLLTIAEPS